MQIFALRVCLTTDADLADMPQAFRTPADVVSYLKQSPRNAVVIIDADTDISGVVESSGPHYVMRGASGELNNYYWGHYPAEDPNDAEGGHLTAEQAVRQAVEDMMGGGR